MYKISNFRYMLHRKRISQTQFERQKSDTQQYILSDSTHRKPKLVVWGKGKATNQKEAQIF